jgi:hypothetical protein
LERLEQLLTKDRLESAWQLLSKGVGRLESVGAHGPSYMTPRLLSRAEFAKSRHIRMIPTGPLAEA